MQEYHAKPGETNVHYVFNLTNTSPANLNIFSIGTSCGCTVAKAPAQPWLISPGAGGPVEVDLDLRGRRGLVTKVVYLYSVGYAPKVLTVKAHIPEMTSGLGPDRDRNVKIATADRQAVFRGDCARCHVTPASGKSGAELYAAACGICHDAEHRASFVPDLRNLPHATSRDHWKVWITHGKPGTLMPAFTQSQGGPLSAEQIDSLVDYLSTSNPSKQGLPNPPPPPLPKLFPPVE
jgi:mono/diheme cytochrome c family protein